MKPPRKDQRFKDTHNAPLIVSEKRMTFFVAESMYRDAKIHAGLMSVANAMAEGDDTDDPLPDSPSAVAREAVSFWLDQFRPEKEKSRSTAEWEARLKRAIRAAKRQ